MAAFVAHQRRKVRLATPGASDGVGACVGGPDVPLAALFRLKAADLPEQDGHFPEQQRPKPLGGAALGWKFRPKAARDTWRVLAAPGCPKIAMPDKGSYRA